ncbi:MAG: hypothetical protein ACRD0K_04050 [Egibacteraceae bacterium]
MLGPLILGAVVGVFGGTLVDLDNSLSGSLELLDRARVTWPHQQQFLRILDKYERHSPFVQKLLLDAIRHGKMMQIPNVEAYEFYRYLIDALECCGTWDGIHHGPISKLGQEQEVEDDLYAEYGNEYFKHLSDAVKQRRVRARRIIILSKEHEGDLRDHEVMRAFWEKTGSQVVSYWISEENLELKKRLGNQRLDDVALHDGELCLQYDRERLTVRLDESPKTILVKDLFEALGEFEGGNKLTPWGFSRLTEEDVQTSLGPPTSATPERA